MIKKEKVNNLLLTSVGLAISYTVLILSLNSTIIDEGMSQTEGITLIDPKNVTNQTLQNFTTSDKDMSIGMENKNRSNENG
jgi:hypothetical protein